MKSLSSRVLNRILEATRSKSGNITPNNKIVLFGQGGYPESLALAYVGFDKWVEKNSGSKIGDMITELKKTIYKAKMSPKSLADTLNASGITYSNWEPKEDDDSYISVGCKDEFGHPKTIMVFK